MLGTLSTWLRILGFDTSYAKQNSSDTELLLLAKTEERTLITRDTELMYQARKQLIPCIYLQTTVLDEQLSIVLKQTPQDPALFLSRCTICNSPITSIEKTKVKDKVPQRIYEQHDTFWCCYMCKKIYWAGTHYTHMLNKIEILSQQIH